MYPELVTRMGDHERSACSGFDERLNAVRAAGLEISIERGEPVEEQSLSLQAPG